MYTAEQLAPIAYQAGFRGDALTTIVAIALAESGGDERAHNPVGRDDSWGLTQINLKGALRDRLRQFGLASPEALWDPLTNFKVAFALSGSGKDFTPWSTFTSGKYRASFAGIDPRDWLPGGNPLDWLPGGNPLEWPGDIAGEVARAIAGALGAAVDPFVVGLRRLSIVGITLTGGVVLIVLGAWRGVASGG